jgi:hypothetical protein
MGTVPFLADLLLFLPHALGGNPGYLGPSSVGVRLKGIALESVVHLSLGGSVVAVAAPFFGCRVCFKDVVLISVGRNIYSCANLIYRVRSSRRWPHLESTTDILGPYGDINWWQGGVGFLVRLGWTVPTSWSPQVLFVAVLHCRWPNLPLVPHSTVFFVQSIGLISCLCKWFCL